LQLTTNCLRSCITNPTTEAALAETMAKAYTRESGARSTSGLGIFTFLACPKSGEVVRDE
jgi:hypothetical protein